MKYLPPKIMFIFCIEWDQVIGCSLYIMLTVKVNSDFVLQSDCKFIFCIKWNNFY